MCPQDVSVVNTAFPETTEEQSTAFKPTGGWRLQIQPSIFLLLLRGRRLFTLGTDGVSIKSSQSHGAGRSQHSLPSHPPGSVLAQRGICYASYMPRARPQEKGSPCQIILPSSTLGPGKQKVIHQLDCLGVPGLFSTDPLVKRINIYSGLIRITQKRDSVFYQ